MYFKYYNYPSISITNFIQRGLNPSFLKGTSK